MTRVRNPCANRHPGAPNSRPLPDRTAGLAPSAFRSWHASCKLLGSHAPGTLERESEHR